MIGLPINNLARHDGKKSVIITIPEMSLGILMEVPYIFWYSFDQGIVFFNSFTACNTRQPACCLIRSLAKEVLPKPPPLFLAFPFFLVGHIVNRLRPFCGHTLFQFPLSPSLISSRSCQTRCLNEPWSDITSAYSHSMLTCKKNGKLKESSDVNIGL